MVERSEVEDRVEALETRVSELLLEVKDLAEQLETHLKACRSHFDAVDVKVTGRVADAAW